ncbi:MAG: anion permease [Anaerolineae bacterium]
MKWIFVFVAIALFFDFLNGLHDSSNVVATIISSRALGPRKALLLAAAAEFCGPFIFGVAVAETIGQGIVAPSSVTFSVIMVALFSAIAWNLFTWFLGLPSSSSHALIGGILGAVGAAYGPEVVHMDGLFKVFIILFGSPIVGLVAGYLLMKAVLFLARNASPRVNLFFKRAQLLTSLALALSHGTNDSQKTMGIITMALVASGYLPNFFVPFWVIATCAAAISLGTFMGGWRIIRTLGAKIYRVRPVHGFTVQTASAGIILGAALMGGPVSTTQVVSSAIMGAGSAERVSKVRWNVATNIFIAWVVTIPATSLLAALLYILTPFIRSRWQFL